MQQSPNVIAILIGTPNESSVVTTAIALETARPTGNCQSLKQSEATKITETFQQRLISK
jgi:hypothetical protein